MAKVLIAEDNRLMRWALETSLGRDGHTVRAVESGEAAIEALRDGDYRVVLTDYQLPKLDGIQVLWHVKTESPQTHVIVIAGQAPPELERLARDIGAFAFFEKPLRFTALKEALDFALATPERRKGPRGCCGGCVWAKPCERWTFQETAPVA